MKRIIAEALGYGVIEAIDRVDADAVRGAVKFTVKPDSWDEVPLASMPFSVVSIIKGLPVVRGKPSPMDKNPEMARAAESSGYLCIVTVGAEAYLVDTQGYDYARYVAKISPKGRGKPKKSAPAEVADKNTIMKALDIVIRVQKANENAGQVVRDAVKEMTALGYDSSATDWLWDSNTSDMGKEYLVKLSKLIKSGAKSRNN